MGVERLDSTSIIPLCNLEHEQEGFEGPVEAVSLAVLDIAELLFLLDALAKNHNPHLILTFDRLDE